jgi:transposase InsO family protein
MDDLCGLFGNTRQAYYKKDTEIVKDLMQEDMIITMVKKIRESQPKIGGRKLFDMLSDVLNMNGGRDAFFNILRDNKLLVRKRRTRVLTTNSFHWLRKYPNLIKELTVMMPNKLWVSDITYINVGNEFMYLFLITDAYSRKIIGWKLADTMEAKHGVEALEMAISQLPKDTNGLFHHSDRGVQYCSSKYVECLVKQGIEISMTESGDPRENAIAERVNGILKVEWLYDMELTSKEHATQAIAIIINTYNTERPHLSIGMLTPAEAHLKTGKLKKLWTKQKRKMNLAEI